MIEKEIAVPCHGCSHIEIRQSCQLLLITKSLFIAFNDEVQARQTTIQARKQLAHCGLKLGGSTGCTEHHSEKRRHMTAHFCCNLAITVESLRAELADLAHAPDSAAASMPTSRPFQAGNPAVVFA